MKKSPFFSIIIPCYNQAQFLSECINSVLNQEFNEWEIIIINDGSTDNTYQVSEYFVSLDARIRVIHTENYGLSSARNIGIKLSEGKFLHFLDSDDFVLPGFYFEIFNVVNLDSNIDVFVSGYKYLKDDTFIYEVSSQNKSIEVIDLLTSNIAPPAAYVIKSLVVQQIGNFDETLKSAEDWDFWIRAAKAGAFFKNIAKVLVVYRHVGNSMSRDGFRMYEALKTVTLRSPNHDKRILCESSLNTNYTIDIKNLLKCKLLICLGVSVMQGKVSEAAELFQREKELYQMEFDAGSFGLMYSYLSFRYWRDAGEVAYILGPVYKNYQSFFQKIGLSKIEQKEALKSVFNPVRKIRNRIKFGAILGGLLNRFSN